MLSYFTKLYIFLIITKENSFQKLSKKINKKYNQLFKYN